MLKTKNFTALILLAVLCFTLTAMVSLDTTAYAADGIAEIADGFVYADNNDKQIVGLNLPATVTGDVKIVVPDGVTSIGANAFDGVDYDDGRSRVVGVTLPDSLVSIGNYAFADTAISSVTVPASVKTVGEHAFHGCVGLTSVVFSERTSPLSIGIFAFSGCAAIRTVNLPADTTVSQYAFNGCTSLLWVYVGKGCRFVNTAGTSNATFFPTNTQLTIVFPNAEAYNEALSQTDETFKNNNGSAATYAVKINYYVGSSATPVVYERLHGRGYNYVKDESGYWNVDTAHSVLRVQDAGYASTTWYSESSLTNVVSYDKVNQLLNGSTDSIDLYCHETVYAPVFPEEPASWVYSDDKSYDISDKAQVLQALGCEQTFTEAQLAAMDFKVVFANEKGEVADTPDAIKGNGVYSVTISLNPSYGSWAQTVNPSVTVNVDTTVFNIVLTVFLILGTIGMIATASTAIIRKKVQDRSKRKQLTQKEVLEKFKAIGGESDLIK